MRADQEQLAQVFRNLVVNALSYSGDRPPRGHTSAERVDEMWRFSVAGEGTDIDPKHHRQLFGMVEKSRVGESADVTGDLGPAVCERIIERRDGEIWVESVPNGGLASALRSRHGRIVSVNND